MHVMADALGSVVVLISAAVIRFTDWEYRDYLDPLLSLLIVVIICVTTWPLIRDSTLVLLNSIPPHIDLAILQADLVSTVPWVSSIHELHVWRLVGQRVVASCHLEMFPPMKGQEPVSTMPSGPCSHTIPTTGHIHHCRILCSRLANKYFLLVDHGMMARAID